MASRGRRRSTARTPQTTTFELRDGRKLTVPTIEEMPRIKAFLIVQRNATRDYLDVAALSDCLGPAKSAAALDRLRELYPEFVREGGDVLSTILVKLSNPDPFDLTEIDLAEYKGIIAPWNDWRAVIAQCRALALALLKE